MAGTSFPIPDAAAKAAPGTGNAPVSSPQRERRGNRAAPLVVADGTKAHITVTFATAPTSATVRIAPTLYNKARVLQFEEDDSPASIYTDVLPLLRGGVRNGVSYPGLRFSDGCGHPRAYTAAVAINGHNPYSNSEWLAPGPTHDASKLLWTQAQELLNQGWDIQNHSDLHTAGTPAPAPAQQVASLDALIAERLQGYKPAVHIVPTNFGGYATAAFAAGYAAVSSAGTSDTYPILNTWDDKRIALSALPSPTTPFVYRRYLADLGTGETTANLLARLKVVSDELLAPGATPSEVYVQRVFTHGIDFGVLTDWLNYTQLTAQDRLWVTTLREFAEYRRVSSQVVKTEALSGSTLSIDLDYAGLSANTRFQNLTLLVNSTTTIASITVTGADSASYNTATKMVNVFRRSGTVTSTPTPTSTPAPTPAPTPTPTPTPAPTPTPTTGCTGTGNILREQWSNVSGSSVGSIPLSSAPSSTNTLTQLEAVTSSENNYGARLRGYVCPPQSGAYTFSFAGDDEAELWLSTDDQPGTKVRIATCAGWTTGPRDYARYAAQRSAPVNLVAGRRYYIEALHKQGWGPGYVSVSWRLPDGSSEAPIAGSRLAPFGPSAPTTTPAPTPTPTPAPTPATGCTGTGSLSREQWNNVSGNAVGNIPVWNTPTSTSTLTQFEAPTGQGNNYGARLRGYVCPPQSGAYSFNIVGDDDSELWLSTDDQPATKVRIATCAGWTNGPRDYTRYAAQRSAPVNLVAGRRYYIEALHKQGWGNDYLAVAWQLPNGTRQEPVPGAVLIPFGTTATNLIASTPDRPKLGSGAALGTTAARSASSAAHASATGAAQSTELSSYPNPIAGQSERATVQFRLAQSGPATLTLHSLTGQLVRQLYSGTLAAGVQRTVGLEAAGLSEGLYLMRLVTPTEVVTHKIMIAHE